MKLNITKVLLLAITLLTISSCKNKSNNTFLSSISGSANEILVVTPMETWKSSVGDSIKEFFGQEQIGLPQSEPIFDLINIPQEYFTKGARLHRNIFIVNIAEKFDTLSYTYFDSPWAKSQKIFKINAPNDSLFFAEFNKKKIQMMSTYLKAERDRLITVYKKTADNTIFNYFKDNHNVLIYCPGGYNINKTDSDFVWASAETSVDSKGFIYFEEPYTDQNQLNDMLIKDRINQKLKEYIPGPLENTWMTIPENIPTVMNSYTYQDKHYAIMIRGLWNVENDFMGGPFIINTILDEKNNRIIYMMAYIYAPETNKRNMLRQVEGIIMSMEVLNKENNN